MGSTPTIDSRYVKPEGRRISRGPSTAKLYRLEERRDAAIQAAANELAAVRSDERAQFWTRTVPEALYDVLESWDLNAAQLAAIAFLERQGWQIVGAPI